MYFIEQFEYVCKEGYSLSGVFGGDTEFKLQCLSNGTFNKAPGCLPVKCGVPPVVAHVEWPKALPYYTDMVAYQCGSGDTTAGKYGDTNSATLSCGPKGQLTQRRLKAIRLSMERHLDLNLENSMGMLPL